MDHATTLSRHIANHTARISIVGQGYVGLPLAVAFAEATASRRGRLVRL